MAALGRVGFVQVSQRGSHVKLKNQAGRMSSCRCTASSPPALWAQSCAKRAWSAPSSTTWSGELTGLARLGSSRMSDDSRAMDTEAAC